MFAGSRLQVTLPAAIPTAHAMDGGLKYGHREVAPSDEFYL